MQSRVLSLLFLSIVFAVGYCVYNGVPVSQGEFPYLVYIMVNPGDSDTYACGGGIINKHYIMSAGHCSWGRKFQIIVGRKSVDGYRSSDVVEVASVVRHDYFNKDGIFDYNDIAIWQLATPLEEKPGFIEYMHIGLNAPPVGTELTLVGFGMIGLGKNTPDAHYGRIHVAEDDQCTFASYRAEVSYCSNNTDYYSCPGDSGTPIVVKPVGASRFISVGINSYGHDGPCGNKNPATVIAKVATMIDWIKRVTPLEQPVFQTVDYDLLRFAPPALTLPGETPVPTPQCNPCEPGWTHWFDFGYTAPTNGDLCQCIEGTPAPETTRAASNGALSLNGNLLVVLLGVVSLIVYMN